MVLHSQCSEWGLCLRDSFSTKCFMIGRGEDWGGLNFGEMDSELNRIS